MTEQSDLAETGRNFGRVDDQRPTAAPHEEVASTRRSTVFAGAAVKDLSRPSGATPSCPRSSWSTYSASTPPPTTRRRSSPASTASEDPADHYVHRNQAELVKSTIREKGRYRVIDKVQVHLNEKDDTYEATFANLGISQVLVPPATVKAHQKLLLAGVWCICDIEYQHSDNARVVPWILGSIADSTLQL